MIQSLQVGCRILGCSGSIECAYCPIDETRLPLWRPSMYLIIIALMIALVMLQIVDVELRER